MLVSGATTRYSRWSTDASRSTKASWVASTSRSTSRRRWLPSNGAGASSEQRKRLSPDESRDRALDAARDILIAEGPQAVTLKAVSARIGRTHANLLHHFGSAAGLQQALARMLAEQVCATIAAAVLGARRGEADKRRIVDLTFDVFDSQGAGALASWMILSGNRDALDPILDAIHRLVDELGEGHADDNVHDETLGLVLMALGDALLGASMAKALGLPRDRARELALQNLTHALAPGVETVG